MSNQADPLAGGASPAPTDPTPSGADPFDFYGASPEGTTPPSDTPPTSAAPTPSAPTPAPAPNTPAPAAQPSPAAPTPVAPSTPAPATPAPQPPEMTPEQIDQILKVAKVDQTFLQSLGLAGSPEQVAAYNRHIQAIVTNAVTVAHAMGLREMAAYKPPVDPRLEALYGRYEAQQQAETRDNFFKEQPELGKFPEIVKVAAAEASRYFESQGIKPEQITLEQAKAKVVEVARSILSRSGINITSQPSSGAPAGAAIPSPAASAPAPVNPVPAMNPMLSPGHSAPAKPAGGEKADQFSIYDE